jgi:hypothetical protein
MDGCDFHKMEQHGQLKYLCPFLRQDFRNVVFGLATDGFNPFGSNSASHSTWPVILVIYNFPPDMAIKAQNLMLSMIIPGMLCKCFQDSYYCKICEYYCPYFSRESKKN